MSLTVVYDPVLSRVRITTDGNLVKNPGFDVNADGWNAQGGTLARVTSPTRTPPGSALLTPNGIAAIVLGQIPTFADMPEVTGGESYTGSGWFWSDDTLTQVSIVITWWDVNGVSGTTSASATTALPNGAFTQYSVTAAAPATGRAQLRARIHGTPTVAMTMNLDDMAVFATAVATFDVERSTNGITWTPVRGGSGVPLTNGIPMTVDDYEFPVGVPVTYRATYRKADSTILSRGTAVVTPTLDKAWLKFIARPFLNRAVTVVDFSDVSRPARNGVHEIIGRSFPVGTSTLRGSRRYELQVLTEQLDEADELDIILSAGEPVFVQVPAGSLLPRSMYAMIGDVAQSRPGRLSTHRVFSLPLTEVAAPAPEIVGSTITYLTVRNTYVTYADLLAAKATYLDLLEGISPPSDVIVP